MIEIPLQAGAQNSHQRFAVQLGDNLVDFRLDWNFLYDRWAVNLSIEGASILSGGILAAGAAVNRHAPDMGRLYFVGEDATLDNLGKSNTLVWIDG